MGQQQQRVMQPGMDMMAERKMSLKMGMYRDQAMGPNQYFLQDKFGNYAYAYANQNSEKKEEGDQNSVKGHYAYIMSNGQRRRVDYIADNQGFHVIRDDAVNDRLKRSVEPDLIQTKMTSYMDSSSLRDDSRDMYRMMSPNNMMYRNRMGMRDNQMSRNMGRDMYMNNVLPICPPNCPPGWPGSNDMSSQMVNRNMMSQGMSTNMMNRNMMGEDMSNNMMDMSNMRNNQMMGQDMIYSNMNRMNQGMNRMNSYANNELMGQNRNMMSQRMEIEQVPSNRFF